MEKYEVGGEIITSKIKWGVIVDIDPESGMLCVEDEDGGCYDVYECQVISYNKGFN